MKKNKKEKKMVKSVKKLMLTSLVAMFATGVAYANPIIATKAYVDDGLGQKQTRLTGSNITAAEGKVAIWGNKGDTDNWKTIITSVDKTNPSTPVFDGDTGDLVTAGAIADYVASTMTATGTINSVVISPGDAAGQIKYALNGGVATNVSVTGVELSGNKTSVIDTTPSTGNSTSTSEYTSVKAVVDYVTNEISTMDLSAKQDKLSGTEGEVLIYTDTAGTIGSLMIDDTAGGTADSEDLITSGAVHAGLGTKQGLIGGGTNGTVITNSGTAGTVNSLAVDSTAGGTTGSANLITSGAVHAGLASKLNANTCQLGEMLYNDGTGLVCIEVTGDTYSE